MTIRRETRMKSGNYTGADRAGRAVGAGRGRWGRANWSCSRDKGGSAGCLTRPPRPALLTALSLTDVDSDAILALVVVELVVVHAQIQPAAGWRSHRATVTHVGVCAVADAGEQTARRGAGDRRIRRAPSRRRSARTREIAPPVAQSDFAVRVERHHLPGADVDARIGPPNARVDHDEVAGRADAGAGALWIRGRDDFDLRARQRVVPVGVELGEHVTARKTLAARDAGVAVHIQRVEVIVVRAATAGGGRRGAGAAFPLRLVDAAVAIAGQPVERVEAGVPFVRFDPVVVVHVEVDEGFAPIEVLELEVATLAERALADLVAVQHAVAVPVMHAERLRAAIPFGSRDLAVAILIHAAESRLGDLRSRRSRRRIVRRGVGAEVHAARTRGAPIDEAIRVLLRVHERVHDGVPPAALCPCRVG